MQANIDQTTGYAHSSDLFLSVQIHVQSASGLVAVWTSVEKTARGGIPDAQCKG
jgi:hypothetical protein